MSDYYIVRDVHSAEFEFVIGFSCARCMLPEKILSNDYLRETLMLHKYSDYNQRAAEYERRFRTGEISSELLNFAREAIIGGTHGIRVNTLNDLQSGICIRMRTAPLI